MTGRTLRTLSQIAVSELKAVTPKKAGGLRAMDIETVLDLLTHYPRRLVDRTQQLEIAALVEGAEGVVTADVVHSSARRLANRRTMAEIVVADATGSLTCTFFNQPWRAKQFEDGQKVTVFGKVTLYRGRRQMANPLVDLVGDQTGRIVPIYPQSEKAQISSVELSRFVEEALGRAGEFAEPLPGRYLRRVGLVGRTEAFGSIHAPETFEARRGARRRLAFDELLRLQLRLVMHKRAVAEASQGVTHLVAAGGLVDKFLGALPFVLTEAQRRAVDQIAADLALPHPMHRLLQGDVGSGKTVVALAALLYGVQGGHQGAFMAPTEVLAEQHHLSSRHLLEGLSVPDASRLGGTRPLDVALLTSRTPGAERARILAGLDSGELDLLIGTHALLTEGVQWRSLGVVVVDEQHRFGVEQRAALREKGAADPDLLVMTATPIPRTAAMTVYGDLDHTILDELPAGRTAIETRWLAGGDRDAQAWKRVRSEVAAGRQAYVVCPRVGGGLSEDEAADREDDLAVLDPEDDDGGAGAEAGGGGDAGLGTERQLAQGGQQRLGALAQGGQQRLGALAQGGQQRLGALAPGDAERPPPRRAIEERDRLAAGELAGLEVGLLHGQLPSKEKERIMAAFRDGEIQVLVATTVVEVGVDVANATVMVIEDADRFGIAQLHQLRGRVGRASHRSWCYLLTVEVTPQAERRLEAMVRTENGFELAEEDLDLRGGGTLLGARQKGRSDLKLASLRLDRDLVSTAREVAVEIVDADGDLSHPEHALLADEVRLFVSEDEAQFLFRG